MMSREPNYRSARTNRMELPELRQRPCTLDCNLRIGYDIIRRQAFNLGMAVEVSEL